MKPINNRELIRFLVSDNHVKLLNDRVAVITGSTKGNGRAIANIYSEQGANVVITGRSPSEAQNVATVSRIKHGGLGGI